MYVYPKEYEVIVIGGGHAGVEAALAASRMGCQTLLLTINADTIAQMSCNPAIGGSAKGHLVREIDALGGQMGKVADLAGIQFKMLNRKKGPSVWSPRAQCDKKRYQFTMKNICELQSGIDIRQGQATGLIADHGRICGVETSLGITYLSKTVVVTTGTFLRGLMHIGESKQSGGRMGEGAAMQFSDSLARIGFKLGRFKTGTPPRLSRRSINFSKMEAQPGDYPIPFFSFWSGDVFHVEQSTAATHGCCYPEGSTLKSIGRQMECHITYTTGETARVIQENIHKSPMFSGQIEGTGPRYCPSIEDKIVRFRDKDRHQLFLEPEGVATEEIYVNGFSTSLPFDVQLKMIRSVIGCEQAEIIRPAYAVEYDFVFPTQLFPSLEAKICEGLFMAGQINGTSGYEEAAAQGLIAGVNASRKAQGLTSAVIGRDRAYIGVLIDDLVTKGVIEPYRVFTSKAEYRLLLRQDNADIRLSGLGYELGLLSESNFKKLERKRRSISAEIERLENTKSNGASLAKALRQPEVGYRDLDSQNPTLTEEVIRQVEIAIKYEGYIRRQESDISRQRSLETKLIPTSLDYCAVGGLKTEARQKLAQSRPSTLGQASRISGVSPADIGVLAVFLKRGIGGGLSESQDPGQVAEDDVVV